MYAFKILFQSVVNREVTHSILVEYLCPGTPYWYLITLFYYYLFIYLFVNPCKKDRKTMILCLSTVASAMLPFVYEHFDIKKNYLLTLSYHFVFFAFGYFAYQNWEQVIGVIKSKKMLPILSIISVAIYVINPQVTIYPFVKIILTISLIVGIVSFVLNSEKLANNKLLCYFGRHSIYIYLIHNYITVALRTGYMKLGFYMMPMVYFIICLMATLTVCAFVQLVASKIWVLDIFFRPLKTLNRLIFEKEK